MLSHFLERHMKKGNQFVPARLQAALALLERLRERPSLDLKDHLAGRGSSGLESHQAFGNRAHKRLGIQPINKNHGRSSSNLRDWGQGLLNALKTSGSARAGRRPRRALIDEAQEDIAMILRRIPFPAQKPLLVRLSRRSAVAIVRDLLKQAEEKGKSGDVAQYLVGAKLMLHFNWDGLVYPANKADRKSRSDRNARAGDFQIANAVIEVAMGLPDEKHVAQIAEVLEDSESEVWLLTRSDRVETWQTELADFLETDIPRVVVTSVEVFIGQNITELGKFSTKLKAAQLRALIDLYNTRWVQAVGTPGIRIVMK